MQRKYELLLIILFSTLIAFFIYNFNKREKIYLSAFGDGVSSGETAYNIAGISYNDYIKDYFEDIGVLEDYNKSFSKKNYKLSDMLKDLNNNSYNNKEKMRIKQAIDKSHVITISFGEDELTKQAITKDLNDKVIRDFLNNYDILLTEIRKINHNKIFVIGIYENEFLEQSRTIIINAELSNLARKHNCEFVNIESLLTNEDFFLNKKSYYFSYRAHEIISKTIINSL